MTLGRIEKRFVLITDVGMLLYWLIIFMAYAGIAQVPPEYMYSDYGNPLIVAWNLSFLPIDIAFSVLGLAAMTLPLQSSTRGQLNTISLTLMLCAGLMAISFWSVTGAFDLLWWAVNGWLVLLPMVIFVIDFQSR